MRSAKYCGTLLFAILAFYSGAAYAATFAALTTTPYSLVPGTPTMVTFSVRITPDPGEVITLNGVNLLAVTGATSQVLGVMNDSGTAGDAAAGDGIYTFQTALTGNSTQPLNFQVSAATKGTLRRQLSPILSLPVAGANDSGAVTVNVVNTDYSQANNLGASAGAGVLVKANGVVLGSTNGAGQFQATLSPGTYEIEARLPSQAAGTASVTVLGGSQQSITIPLDYDEEITEDATQTIDEVSGYLFPSSAPALTLRLRTAAGPLTISQIGSIEVRDEEVASSPPSNNISQFSPTDRSKQAPQA